MKRIISMFLAIVMVLSLTAMTVSAEEYTGPDTYSMIDSFDISTLDYVYNNKASNGDYLNNFIEGLLTQDSHGVLIPGMATEWSCNEDASEWYFTLREDAVWSTSEGEEYDYVVAEDFVTGLKHAADTQSETIGLVSGLIVGLQDYIDGTATWDQVGIKAEGNKLTYTLNGPCGYFDGMTTYTILFPINAEFLESMGDKFGAVEASSILYNGCYILSSLVPAQEVRFDANPNYYDKENVFVKHVVVTYTDGADPTQNFNMFVNGEVTESTILTAYPDVVAKANELYAANQYKSLTTATTYWGAFNFDRQMYTLFNDSTAIMTNKNDAQRADAKAAILNKNFRLAIYSAFSDFAYEAVSKAPEYALDAARNTLVPYTFATTSTGNSYGSLVTKYLEEIEPAFAGIDLTDGQDAWYNPERAQAFAAKAKEELGGAVSEWPVVVDYCILASSETQKNRALALEKAIEDAIGEYVDIDIIYIEGDASAYYSAFFDINLGRENSADLMFGAGWGPDYGDPLTYIHCYDINEGDMLHYSGLDLASEMPLESGEAAKETIGLTAIQAVIDAANASTGDERIELFAKAEAMLLAEGIIRPFETSGGNLKVSKVVPFTVGYGLYGQASFNAVPYFKYMQLSEEPITTEAFETAKAAWMEGK